VLLAANISRSSISVLCSQDLTAPMSISAGSCSFRRNQARAGLVMPDIRPAASVREAPMAVRS
jgi:hypothetical protein